MVLNGLRYSRGLMTPQSVLLLFCYALTKHIIKSMFHFPFHMHVNLLLMSKNGLNKVEFIIEDKMLDASALPNKTLNLKVSL